MIDQLSAIHNKCNILKKSVQCIAQILSTQLYQKTSNLICVSIITAIVLLLLFPRNLPLLNETLACTSHLTRYNITTCIFTIVPAPTQNHRTHNILLPLHLFLLPNQLLPTLLRTSIQHFLAQMLQSRIHNQFRQRRLFLKQVWIFCHQFLWQTRDVIQGDSIPLGIRFTGKEMRDRFGHESPNFDGIPHLFLVVDMASVGLQNFESVFWTRQQQR
mmetsp:Transcript_1279/g.2682  ORF Transcript_1279/g.2682 Transcript_1279/m.2682 type:complete len:216 (-) Transcript_1279:74-721(-)